MREPQSERIWGLAKADYLTGRLPVAVLCRGYNLARSSFYERAQREGWLRGDDSHEAEQAGELKPLPLPPPPAPSLPVLVQQAMDRAAAAIAAGDVTAVNGWLRAVERLRKLAIQEVGEVTWVGAKRRFELAAAAAPLAPASPHTPSSPSPSDAIRGPSSLPPAEAGTILGSSPRTTEAEGGSEGGGELWWWYDDEIPPDVSGHSETPETQAPQGIGAVCPDSPAEKICGDRSTWPPPVTEAEVAAAEAELERFTAEIEAMESGRSREADRLRTYEPP